MKILVFISALLISIVSHAQLSISPAPVSGQIALTQSNTYIYITNPISVSQTVNLSLVGTGVDMINRCSVIRAKSFCYIIIAVSNYTTNSQALSVALKNGSTTLATLTVAPVAKPEYSIFTTSSLQMNGFSNYSFVIQNKTQSVKAYSPVFSGVDASKYSIALNKCSSVAVGGTCSVTIKLAPQIAGSYSALITEPQVAGSLSLSSVITNSTPSAIQPQNPSITLSPASQDFGTVSNLGKTAAKEFIITNNGNVSLIPIISLAGTGIEISLNRCSVLSPSQSCSVSVVFNAVSSMTNGVQSGLSISAKANSSTALLTSNLSATLAVNSSLLGSSEGSNSSNIPTEITVLVNSFEQQNLNIEVVTPILVDWGDGTVESINPSIQIFHTYTTGGEYKIKINGAWNYYVRVPDFSSLSNNKNIKHFKFGSELLSANLTGFLNREPYLISVSGVPNFRPNTSLRFMFLLSTSFIGGISSWNMLNVTDIYGILASTLSFNENISSWNTSNIVNMGAALYNSKTFNQPIGLWNTSKVNNMYAMLGNVHYFNQDLSSWDTSKVTDMGYMFTQTYIFNRDISSWDTSKVTNMLGMFYDTQAFNQNISSWNTSSVVNMNDMFLQAYAFNQDLSGWCVLNISSQPSNFRASSPLSYLNTPIWGTCPAR